MLTPGWIKEIYNPKVKGRHKIPIYAPMLQNMEKE